MIEYAGWVVATGTGPQLANNVSQLANNVSQDRIPRETIVLGIQGRSRVY